MTRDPAKFAAFILTHGRADNVVTYGAMRDSGYTGPIYIIIDNEDSDGDEYRRRYGDEWVIEFDKLAVAATVDEADLNTDRRAILYARLASFDIARDLGLDYIIQLDDDYPRFDYRSHDRGTFGGEHAAHKVRDMDGVLRAMVGLLEDSGALCVNFSQGGDQMGLGAVFAKGFTRKAMNSFVVRVDRPIKFVGRLCEDVCAYTLWGSRGELFISTPYVRLIHNPTMAQAGGMTDAYVDSDYGSGGSYIKSMFPVIMAPAFVQIRRMGQSNARLHHHVKWNNAVPKIIPPELRKEAV